MSTAVTLHYLGPEGSFTHAAGIENVQRFATLFETSINLEPLPTARAVFDAVQGRSDYGILAFENNVEGYVVPNLDALIDADDVIGIDRVGIDVVFDAFVRHNHGNLSEVSAHPHGLAQCRNFIEKYDYIQIPATSNAAACKNLTDTQVGLGPRICGELYHLETLEQAVQDYQEARTDFLVLATRSVAQDYFDRVRTQANQSFETVVAFIPLSTGPGVLAKALGTLRDAGLNMTSFISRPIKGHDGTYSFIATVDAAPWDKRFVEAFSPMLDAGDWARTLAVYERSERPAPPVETWMLPNGGVRATASPQADREMMWKGRD